MFVCVPVNEYSPTSDGSAAAIVCSEDFVKRRGLEGQAVQILAMEMATDLATTFKEEAEDSCMKMVFVDKTHSYSMHLIPFN